jgi:hypothetical protein
VAAARARARARARENDKHRKEGAHGLVVAPTVATATQAPPWATADADDATQAAAEEAWPTSELRTR